MQAKYFKIKQINPILTLYLEHRLPALLPFRVKAGRKIFHIKL